MRGASSITHSLYAGLQLIMPGEIAPSHRHIQSALRFVIEGNGAYTAVDGERITMRPGDFIITPSWTWHDHGNPGTEPVVWLDGLDVPMVSFFDSSLHGALPGSDPARRAPRGRFAGALRGEPAAARIRAAIADDAALLLPVRAHARGARGAARRRTRIPATASSSSTRIPATGGYPMPTIGAFVQLLPAGFRGSPYRSTDGTVYSVVEGRGRSRVAGKLLEWEEKDMFVVAVVGRGAARSDADAVLFSFSDRPAQKALGLWREQAPAVTA